MTMKAIAWLAFVGVLIGSVSFIAFLPSPGDAIPVVISDGADEPRTWTPAAETADGVATPAVGRPTTAAEQDEGRVAVEAKAVEAGPVLRVIEAGSQRPLPGAEVFVAAAESQSAKMAGSWWDVLVRSATPLRTDEHGLVTLPPIKGRVRIAARAAGLFGARVVGAGKPEVALALEPDLRMVARVIDARGRPVEGVRVLLCADRGKKLHHRREVVSDAGGLAAFEHVQMYRISVVRRGGPPGSSVVSDHADFVLLAGMPLFDPVMARVSSVEMPSRPVDLRLGPTGAVDVRVCGPDGGVLLTPCRVELTPTKASLAPSPSPWLDAVRKFSTLVREKALAKSSARFEAIGAGLIFDARVVFSNRRWNFSQAGLAGPGAGESREIVLRMPSHFALLSGRLVDAEGRPMGALPASMQVNGSRGPLSTEGITTSAGGRFELAFKVAQSASGYTLDVRRTAEDSPAGALVVLPNLVPGRRCDLGDVRLATLSVLAFGTVRDDRGQPVGGAKVSLQSFRPAAGRGGVGSWVHEATAARAETDADGQYQLFAERRPLRLRLEARAGGHAAAQSRDLGLGERVDFTMERHGVISVKGTAPSWLPRSAMSYVLSRDGAKVRDRAFSTRSGGAFQFRIDSLVSGIYDVAITLRGVGRPLAEFVGVVVAPGAEASDSRLADIDLSRSVFRYVVQAVDPDGGRSPTPSSPLLVRVTGSAGEVETVGFPWRSGQVEFYVPEPAVDVVALSRGRLPLRAHLQTGESRLTLQPAPPVELRIPGLRQLVGTQMRVRVSMGFDGDIGVPMTKFRAIDQKRGSKRNYSSAGMGKSSEAWLDDGDRCRFTLMHEGRYVVVARFYPAGEPKSKSTSLTLGSVSVAMAGGRVPALTLTPSAVAVTAALSR